ncbi:MAG: hypothetical protein AUG51_03645 [Acidobacteria bacterium 13_1_20CM_3_53_8]|nr:MAG: hypothetical protein AUG51_03645 [Acidobacteria bacterium 13_1_20CM_3_53_8]
MVKPLNQSMSTLRDLPASLPREGAIALELEQGVLVFRASRAVQERIETLLLKQRASNLTPDEERELQWYEEMDDFLSYINRLTRNEEVSAA